jgi:hypothetical protein
MALEKLDYFLKKFDDFCKILENKTIAVVGNALSLFEQSHGKSIDSHDVVIRFNSGCVLDKIKHPTNKTTNIDNTHGTKISVGSLSTQDTKLIKILNQKNIPIINPNVVHPQGHDKVFRQYAMTPEVIIEDLYKIFGFRKPWPSSGCIIVHTLMSDYVNCKSVALFGFDFMTSSSWHSPNLKVWHKFEKEKEYMQGLHKQGKIKIF